MQFILVLFVCWNLFWTIANLRVKCVTETKNVSLLFYKNLKSSFVNDSHIWLEGFFTFLVALAHGAARPRSPPHIALAWRWLTRILAKDTAWLPPSETLKKILKARVQQQQNTRKLLKAKTHVLISLVFNLQSSQWKNLNKMSLNFFMNVARRR